MKFINENSYTSMYLFINEKNTKKRGKKSSKYYRKKFIFNNNIKKEYTHTQ